MKKRLLFACAILATSIVFVACDKPNNNKNESQEGENNFDGIILRGKVISSEYFNSTEDSVFLSYLYFDWACIARGTYSDSDGIFTMTLPKTFPVSSYLIPAGNRLREYDNITISNPTAKISDLLLGYTNYSREWFWGFDYPTSEEGLLQTIKSEASNMEELIDDLYKDNRASLLLIYADMDVDITSPNAVYKVKPGGSVIGGIALDIHLKQGWNLCERSGGDYSFGFRGASDEVIEWEGGGYFRTITDISKFRWWSWRSLPDDF